MGFGLCLIAALSLFLRAPARVRVTRAAALAASGALLAGTALAWPPEGARRSPRAFVRIDEFVPEFQFEEFHERRIHATPERIFRAIHDVPAREIRLFRLLTWIRNPRLPGTTAAESILNPPAEKPILEAALRSGFVLLSEEKDREIVLGTFVARPRGSGVSLPARAAEMSRIFASVSAPGYAKAVMNFRIETQEDGFCLLTTETRIFATDPRTARHFATYWRFILPGSSLLRVTWLRAIAARAERAEKGAP